MTFDYAKKYLQQNPKKFGNFCGLLDITNIEINKTNDKNVIEVVFICNNGLKIANAFLTKEAIIKDASNLLVELLR